MLKNIIPYKLIIRKRYNHSFCATDVCDEFYNTRNTSVYPFCHSCTWILNYKEEIQWFIFIQMKFVMEERNTSNTLVLSWLYKNSELQRRGTITVVYEFGSAKKKYNCTSYHSRTWILKYKRIDDYSEHLFSTWIYVSERLSWKF